MGDEFRRKARVALSLCQDIGELRRGIITRNGCGSTWSGLRRQTRKEQLRAFELALEEIKQWAAVQRRFQAAFALYRQHRSGQPPAQIKLNQTRSNQRQPGIKIME
jgi:hypothetical protein